MTPAPDPTAALTALLAQWREVAKGAMPGGWIIGQHPGDTIEDENGVPVARVEHGATRIYIAAFDPSRIARKAALARWGNQAHPLRALHTGTLDIGQMQIPCAVLEGEARVLSRRGFYQGLGASTPGRYRDDGELPPFLAAKNLRPFISEDLATTLKRPILYVTPGPGRARGGGAIALGIPAEIIPAVCDVWLKARDAGALHYRQEHIAARAELLMRGLAHTGIIALIDEATGYQYERGRDELATILRAFIAKELRKWVHTFPPDFYKEMFRLRGLGVPSGNCKRPGFIGGLTNDLVYMRLAPGVLEELRHKNPSDGHGRRKHKHHQWLTADIGDPRLREHLAAVTAMMKAEDDWPVFVRKLDRVFPRFDRTLPLPLRFSDDIQAR